MEKYVVGFAFDAVRERVLLVNKLRPSWQKGCLNGIGGKVEKDDKTLLHAMNREAKEEARLEIEWHIKGVMRGTNNDDVQFECHIFSAFTDDIWNYKQLEDEKLEIINIHTLGERTMISNLEFLIPMCRCNDHLAFATFRY